MSVSMLSGKAAEQRSWSCPAVVEDHIFDLDADWVAKNRERMHAVDNGFEPEPCQLALHERTPHLDFAGPLQTIGTAGVLGGVMLKRCSAYCMIWANTGADTVPP